MPIDQRRAALVRSRPRELYAGAGSDGVIPALEARSTRPAPSTTGYRVTLIVEFATRGGVGTGGGHYHSIYRNPANEYGGG